MVLMVMRINIVLFGLLRTDCQRLVPYILSVKLGDFYCVKSYLMEKLSELRNFDRQ